MRDFEQWLESTALHSADQFEDRSIRSLEADHADRGTVRPLDLLERRHTLDLLCLQIRVRPVDIVDAEDDAADADVVGGQSRAGPIGGGSASRDDFPLLNRFSFQPFFTFFVQTHPRAP